MTMSWPQGVTDQTSLPFSVWRVLDALANAALSGVGETFQAGSPSAAEGGGAPNDEQVRSAVALAEQYAARAQRQDQAVDQATLRGVTAALVASIGPMGEVMVEDAMEDLPQPVRLAALLKMLGQELQDTQRQAFGRQLRTRGLL
ncbi:hypothetical protein [Deinococcus sp.]|uniref:hypothetical protein n=1 Tax=Deinococcus sp. TaxID=47478 RepID=UPI0025D1E81E|nr:hypothetical protein [Deinococcus sp.]